MMKKGLAKVSLFMMVAAMAASVAACTPDNKKGGEKPQTETTAPAKVSMENTKKDKANKPEKKKKKEANTGTEAPTKAMEDPVKVAEAPKQAEKGLENGQVQGPGIGPVPAPGGKLKEKLLEKKPAA